MRTVFDWMRRFDPSFLVTLAVLAVLAVTFYVFANVTQEQTGGTGGRFTALVNGDLEALNYTPVAPRTPARTVTAVQTATVVVASTPVVQLTPTVAAAPPTTTPLPATATPVITFGQVRQFTGGGVIIREQPNRNSPPVGTISSGERVEILATVQGEAVEAGETAWYRIRYRNLVGFIYSRLVDKLP